MCISFLCSHAHSRSAKHRRQLGIGQGASGLRGKILEGERLTFLLRLFPSVFSYIHISSFASALDVFFDRSDPTFWDGALTAPTMPPYDSFARLRVPMSDLAIRTSPLIFYPIRAWTSRSSAGKTRYVVSCVDGVCVCWRARRG